MTETLGDIAQAVGAPQFLQVVYESLVRFVDFDAVHLDYDRVRRPDSAASAGLAASVAIVSSSSR